MKNKKAMASLISLVLLVLIIGAVALFGKKTESKVPDSSQSKTTQTEAGISWANGIWLNKINKESIEHISIVNSKQDKNDIDWSYDGFDFSASDTSVTIYVTDKLSITGTAANMFADLTNLKSISGLDLIDFSKCINVNGLFKNCKNLEEVDLESTNFESAEDISSMFEGCEKLKKCKLSNSVTNAKKADSMFNGCISLSELSAPKTPMAESAENMFNGVGDDVGNTVKFLGSLDFSNCKNFNGMFKNAHFVDYKFLNNANIIKIESAESMFHSSSIESIDMTSWNVENLKTTENMFRNCSFLHTVNTNGWDCKNLTTCQSMFDKATALINLTLNWKNVSGIKNTNSMFKECSSLKSLDLSCFNDISVTDATRMFYCLDNVESIKCTKINAEQSDEMFTYTSNIKGATPFDESKVNASMADTNGYFVQ